jgi:hypothetical protein
MYLNKYLKYKNKYLELKKKYDEQYGGAPVSTLKPIKAASASGTGTITKAIVGKSSDISPRIIRDLSAKELERRRKFGTLNDTNTSAVLIERTISSTVDKYFSYDCNIFMLEILNMLNAIKSLDPAYSLIEIRYVNTSQINIYYNGSLYITISCSKSSGPDRSLYLNIFQNNLYTKYRPIVCNNIHSLGVENWTNMDIDFLNNPNTPLIEPTLVHANNFAYKFSFHPYRTDTSKSNKSVIHINALDTFVQDKSKYNLESNSGLGTALGFVSNPSVTTYNTIKSNIGGTRDKNDFFKFVSNTNMEFYTELNNYSLHGFVYSAILNLLMIYHYNNNITPINKLTI